MQNSLAKKKLSNFNNFMLKAIKKNTPTKLRVYEVRVANVLWTSVWNTSKTNLSFQLKVNPIKLIRYFLTLNELFGGIALHEFLQSIDNVFV